MDTSIIVAILARCAGVATGAIGAMVTMKGKRLDHDVEREKLLVGAYEKTLFEARLVDYRNLWALTESTSRRYIDQLVADAAAELAEKMTQWYYRKGGLLLSATSRNAFSKFVTVSMSSVPITSES